MFVQVVQGRTTDAEALRAALDRWVQDLAPGAVGWLGSTAGVTEDGQVIAMARFESAEAAERNSRRPEQTRWWTGIEELLEGQATFRDSENVTVDLQGDPDQAGFVQVMQGRTSDPERANRLMAEDPEKWAAFRPDVLGSVVVTHEDGLWTMFLYFTSEAEAREGERKEAPPEMRASMEELDKLSLGEPEFFDLKEPVLLSPR